MCLLSVASTKFSTTSTESSIESQMWWYIIKLVLSVLKILEICIAGTAFCMANAPFSARFSLPYI